MSKFEVLLRNVHFWNKNEIDWFWVCHENKFSKKFIQEFEYKVFKFVPSFLFKKNSSNTWRTFL